MTGKVLVSLDLGEAEDAKQLLKTAEELANLRKDELHIVTVVPSYSMPIVGSYFGPGEEEKVLERALAALKSFLSENAASSEKVKGHIAHGSIYSEIMRVADELDCDLIVIGAHRPGLGDYLLGPNAARVVRHAKQSVYVVRH
ncbi:universal stress protein [Labrenzia sp. OB1]|uniref:universal stress protein n=1 Tax=Labrenzia sp. OB1 TaxID=1561204 RepID=UPI0007B29A1C|nr:universal stress protein [Labrenzia sp. OB1]KZM50982.1 universal stress protein UspA [Labrenzia sp. OB1]